MTNNTFENYLRGRHADQYTGLDDDMLDDCGEWMAELDVQELIDYAETWGKLYAAGPFLNDKQRIEKELFDMVYQWGRVGLVTDESCNSFQGKIRELIKAHKL